MSTPRNVNVHNPEFRETKPVQGHPTAPVTELFKLNDRTIIVTGASGFLGIHVSTAILESGGDVVGLDVGETPPAAHWDKCNICDEAGVAAVFEKIAASIKTPIRGLVACAGVSIGGPAIEFPLSDLHKIVDVNLIGTFLTAQATAREVQKSGQSASFVLVASMSGYISNKGSNTAGYCASKAAVQQLGRSLAAEWGSRVGMPLIRVNTLSPGYIRTAATAQALQRPGLEKQWINDNMLLRLSTADEFRAPVVYMLSDGSSFMTGADLRVDGGHCAW
ncbi:oxidoreductase, short chain dehydrogenase/reductase family [Niveomyces insectorum RCEF 264]|uniref:Oxidoreductase, short chain dehydrogenase/reductase family n=1 Tax=Niveomyces insectorum RCEF 264 TaxID=1081102 RepID=A0A167W6T2_9HYPO|nr:oxidoreductase, short chain dehydrogenase/reductase family [Niveomyces insectorum RCEF 264]